MKAYAIIESCSIIAFMASRFREVIESIVYAGMKPGAPAAQSQRMRWLGPLRRPVERLLSGGSAPSDPLYLTNRTLGQKIRFAAAIGVPCLAVVTVMTLALSNYFVKKGPGPKPEPTARERAESILPNLGDIRVNTNRDVDVMELRIDRTSGIALLGTAMNNTAHEIQTAELVFDLVDSSGSQLGGVSQRLEKLAPQTRLDFRLPILQKTAQFALVREVRTR
jgi:hypothetical protein